MQTLKFLPTLLSVSGRVVSEDGLAIVRREKDGTYSVLDGITDEAIGEGMSRPEALSRARQYVEAMRSATASDPRNTA